MTNTEFDAIVVEMATAWHGLGAAVALLVLPRMEQFVGERVVSGLRDGGVDVRIGVSVRGLKSSVSGPVTVILDDDSELVVDEVMFATGRRPLTDDLGLDTVGLQPGTWLDVDDTLTVSGVDGDWLYAVGDANHRALLTHQGKYQARIAAAVIANRANSQPIDTSAWSPFVATADILAVPQAFFTDPEAGSVGLTADQARRAGHRITVIDVEIGEILHSATIAVAGQVPIARLWHAVPCFPTVSELWLRLLEAFRDGRRSA